MEYALDLGSSAARLVGSNPTRGTKKRGKTMIKTKLEKPKTTRHKLHVEVSAERTKKSADAALKEMQKETEIKGFRKGQAPFEILRKHLGHNAEKEIAKQIVRDTYIDAIKQENAAPMAEPYVEFEAYKDGEPFIYRAEFDVMPEITVPEYEGISLEKEKMDVTDAEVEAEIKRLQHAMTQLEPSEDGELGAGMMALIDFKGTVDGKSFKGGDAEKFVVDFGTLMPAFEEKIKGMKNGEERDITVRYPDDYFNKEISGKEGAFHVKLKELRKKIIPEINSDFAKTLGKFNSMDEVRADIKKHIATAKEDYQKRRLGSNAIRTLAEKNPLDVPEVMIQNELGAMLEDAVRQIKAQGKNPEDTGLDAKSFVSQNLDEATKRVRGYLIAFAIAKEAEIKVTDEELDARIASIARQANQSLDKVKAQFSKDDMKERLRSQLLYEKTLDFIVGKAKVKEIKPKKEKK